MSKRAAEDPAGGGATTGSGGGAPPPIKKVHFEPHLIGPISTLEEMDIKVLQFQNKKLAQRIEQRVRCEAELRQRIEQLEKRQTQDDAVLNVVNRYWNQLNEDIRVLLQRFDAETADESENKNENEVTTSFLMQLSTWDKEELDDKLANRVQVSKRAVAKIVQVFDRLMQRNEKITLAMKGESEDPDAQVPDIDETLRQSYTEVMAENRNLLTQNTLLHEKFHTISLKMSEIQDMLNGKDTESAELKNQIDDLQYELEKVRCRNDKLENHLAEAIEKLKAYHQLHGDISSSDKDKHSSSTTSSAKGGSMTSVAAQHLEDLQKELEEYKELANNRLQELDKLHLQHREALKEVEKLKMDIRQLPESVIVETTEYKCLQSQFSVLYNESMQIKTLLDENRNQLQTSKNQHLRQIEMMESEELIAQKRVRSDMIQMEDVLSQIRKEYEMLRIEFEQNMAANEQTAPINREMRHLITSLQNHNGQLKGEVQRYKKKYKEVSADNAKLRKELEEVTLKLTTLQEQQQADIKKESEQSAAASGIKEEPGACDGLSSVKDENSDDPSLGALKSESGEEGDGCDPNGVKKEEIGPDGKPIKVEAPGTPKGDKDQRAKSAESDLVRDLRNQIKKALNDQKEMKLLLDMYKGVSKEQRDKVQLMASEKKKGAEIEDLKNQMKKLQESKREDRKKLADEEALRKIKQLEEQKYELQKQVQNQKQPDSAWSGGYRPFVGSHVEEEALLNEMEVTGQAFEDMQEQNSRLIQQLREKDDANFKLMSDRIKANQMHKLLREEKQVLEDQVTTRDSQIEAMHVVLRKLEEKERILQNTVTTIEKELVARQQAMEMHKRKAIESAQSAADLKLHLEKYHAQMKEAQQVVAEKTSSLEAEAYKTKRLQEELAQFKRKAERMKKIEMSGTTIDEVMLEEIREYKETLTCPSCKVKRKDAVLSKCFHVFCYDCLRTRYETRQRKCPKCNCAFGANDYHRLYLST
ncbi:E3 ubiquitin-protein ligase Bre1 isoform X1 [Topomyia yanbarensis]|uniref:E3 ubiquitin-protein ligase Bre1 isoform X1 n=1 Tax=Topomyia yanbarensis TaxID=2498891 RepID=UPI00273C7165|nr:E3 ubiquitin-protein ligase Bre1 isoform X1 [Topomyia yanbarensis]XP_058829250.1 E3 ubiquitin-protein ligase Bre1 isoform X1 [Topomyia yanbarensis]